MNYTVLFYLITNLKNKTHFKKVDEANVKLFVLLLVHREINVKDAKKSVMSITKLSPGLFCLY
jgi:hypothetical protein